MRQVHYSTQVQKTAYQDAVFPDESDFSSSIEEFEDGRAVMEPSWSVGANLHDAGQCRPCAWSWRPGGCSHGASCKFCHLCGEDAVKLRSKVRVKEQRARRRGIRGTAQSEVGFARQANHRHTEGTSPAVQLQKVADQTSSSLEFRQLLQQHMTSLPKLMPIRRPPGL